LQQQTIEMQHHDQQTVVHYKVMLYVQKQTQLNTHINTHSCTYTPVQQPFSRRIWVSQLTLNTGQSHKLNQPFAEELLSINISLSDH